MSPDKNPPEAKTLLEKYVNNASAGLTTFFLGMKVSAAQMHDEKLSDSALQSFGSYWGGKKEKKFLLQELREFLQPINLQKFQNTLIRENTRGGKLNPISELGKADYNIRVLKNFLKRNYLLYSNVLLDVYPLKPASLFDLDAEECVEDASKRGYVSIVERLLPDADNKNIDSKRKRTQLVGIACSTAIKFNQFDAVCFLMINYAKELKKYEERRLEDDEHFEPEWKKPRLLKKIAAKAASSYRYPKNNPFLALYGQYLVVDSDQAQHESKIAVVENECEEEKPIANIPEANTAIASAAVLAPRSSSYYSYSFALKMLSAVAMAGGILLILLRTTDKTEVSAALFAAGALTFFAVKTQDALNEAVARVSSSSAFTHQ